MSNMDFTEASDGVQADEAVKLDTTPVADPVVINESDVVDEESAEPSPEEAAEEAAQKEILDNLVIPEDQLDAEGFPIIPADAYSLFDQIGMPTDMAEQIITTAKETIRSLLVQKSTDPDSWNSESEDLMKSSMDTMKMYWKTYQDLKSQLPSKEEMLNLVTNFFDSQYFDHYSSVKGLREYGNMIGIYTNAQHKYRRDYLEGNDVGEDISSLLNPAKYLENLKKYAYFMRKLYQVPGLDGASAKSVLEKANFLPVMVITSLVHYFEKGAESVKTRGLRKIIETDLVKSKIMYDHIIGVLDIFKNVLVHTDQPNAIRNAMAHYFEHLASDKSINKTSSDEGKSFWQSIIRGRLEEFTRTVAFILSPNSFTDLQTLREVAPNSPEHIRKEEELHVVSISIYVAILQTMVSPNFFADIWDFMSQVRDEGHDTKQMNEEAIRYYVGQISYWCWILLHFDGDTDEELNTFYGATNDKDIGVFKAMESFKGLNHPNIRSKFFEVFNTAINDMAYVFEELDHSALDLLNKTDVIQELATVNS